MATLLVSGDSWTSCWPLEETLGHRNNGWPRLVSEHFGFNLIDKSRAGSSNYRIYRKAVDGMISGIPDICLVFLTSWIRFEFGSAYGKHSGRIYQWLPNQSNNKEQNEYAFKNFFNGYKNYTDMLRMIISLQSISKAFNIPCWFMNTFDSNEIFNLTLDKFISILKLNQAVFDSMDDIRIQEKFEIVKQLINSIDRTTFISEQSYQSLIDGLPLNRDHPTEQGHKLMSEVVITFLENNIRD